MEVLVLDCVEIQDNEKFQHMKSFARYGNIFWIQNQMSHKEYHKTMRGRKESYVPSYKLYMHVLQ